MERKELFHAFFTAIVVGILILQYYDGERKDDDIKELTAKFAQLEGNTHKRHDSFDSIVASLEKRTETLMKGELTEAVFLIDWSYSISDKDFRDSLAFVRNIPNLFGKNWEKHTYGILLFNETVQSKFIGQFKNKQNLEEIVSGITRVKGGTSIAYALRYVQVPGKAFMSFGPNSRRYLFIVTDGENTDSESSTSDIEKEATILKYEQGVRTFSIGVRNKNYNAIVERISSNPKDFFHHFLDNLDMTKIQSALKSF